MIIVYTVRANGRTFKFVDEQVAEGFAEDNGAVVKQKTIPGCDGEAAR